MRRSPSGLVRLALAFAALLGGLSMVIWRQSRALETLRVMDQVRHERALIEAERRELVRKIQVLESRSRIVSVARDRLGMHVPTGTEIVILPLGGAGEDGADDGALPWFRRWLARGDERRDAVGVEPYPQPAPAGMPAPPRVDG